MESERKTLLEQDHTRRLEDIIKRHRIGKEAAEKIKTLLTDVAGYYRLAGMNEGHQSMRLFMEKVREEDRGRRGEEE